MDFILETRKISKIFGGLVAVSQVDMKIVKGQIFGLIGPNGAGKTTLFNIVTGLLHPSNGEVIFKEKQITNFPEYKIVKQGMCRTFQELKIFKNLTVLDNVLIGVHSRSSSTMMDALIKTKRSIQEEKEVREVAFHYLDLLGIKNKSNLLACSLPYGDQRRVEIARALASDPDLLLLDEPSAGMNISEAEELTNLIKWINKELNKTILLIEHNMRVLMTIADWVYVMNQGEKICEGEPKMVQNSPEVIESYLGRSYLEKEMGKC